MNASRPDSNRRRRRLGAFLFLVGVPLLALAIWVGWAEQNPEQERELRVEVQDRLHEWFPETMELPDDLQGFLPRSDRFDDERPPDVLLLHGLDEPGDIWDALAPALDDAGINGWEFRYPNDQAIDHSADLLAEHWAQLEGDDPLVLLGHSMGGLVIRDFVTRYRHPEDATPRVGGRPVAGVILVATPNHGSEWARLRVWLEVREWLADIQQQRFSLFAGLRDGTGAAKIDLRPGSHFLAELNARPWPDDIPVRIIGGKLPEPTPAMRESLAALNEQIDLEAVAGRISEWWEQTDDELGDGVVPVESLHLDGHPDPLILEASHRGLLVPGPLTDEPPAIDAILEILDHWHHGPDT
ncbi:MULTISPECIES: triacylglycerol lipase [unclassified Thioalkalivibrio]|uniref:esterase/lipase family protein n=1 Tax=unclassified Thioalkalivibrio TaxID=2621013 RepID=UPI00036AF5FF|nr:MULTISPECIES: alpha/beta fold hydrolase [unclassified Thioalkalivibrio]